MRLKPATPRSQVEHTTNEQLHSSPHSNQSIPGHYRPTPLEWRFADGPIVAHFYKLYAYWGACIILFRHPRSATEKHNVIMKNLKYIYSCNIQQLHPDILVNVRKRTKKICTNLTEIANEDTQAIDHFFDNGVASVNSNAERTNVTEFYFDKSDKLTCIRKIEEACQRSKYRIIKTIRINMSLVKPLLAEIPNLKVIHLVRDPRGIIHSRGKKKNKWMTMGTDTHSKALCKEMSQDVVDAFDLQTKYPFQIDTFSYEMIASKPVEMTKYLYKFLNMPYDDSVEVWLNKSVRASDDNGYFGAQRKNSEDASTQWRKEMSFTEAITVQKNCARVLSLLGYTTFKSEIKMRDTNLSSMRRYDADDIV